MYLCGVFDKYTVYPIIPSIIIIIYKKMKPILTVISAALCAAGAAAQEPQEADSAQVRQLDEIVIEAPKVIRKADMDVYHPSRSAVDNSKNGMQLLRNLMIPQLTVNDVLGTVKTGAQEVELRINGRKATIDQVKALLPDNIKRVEWIDNPGLRYNGAAGVLNFIVRNPETGGTLMVNAMQALNCAFGPYFADVQLNSGRSQWEAGARIKVTEGLDTHRDYWEKFTMPDGRSLTRTEESLGGEMNNTQGGAWLSYSYIKPDTTVFYASLHASRNFSDKFLYDGLITYSDRPERLLLRDSHGDTGTTPGFSAYLEQHLPGRQTIVVDFNASLYNGHTYHDYVESDPDDGSAVTDVHTSIKDRNQAYGIEADYILSGDNSKFTAGISYSANRNRSEYENMGGEIFHQRQDKVYFFAEYFRRIKKVTLTAGLGAQYTSFLFKETDQGNDTWSLRPQFTATYGINGKHRLRLGFTSWQSAPSLAETNIAPQQTDGFQWRVGNPDLKTSSSYMLTLQYNYTLPRVTGSFGVRAFTSPDAITPYLYWSDNRLVTSYENSRGLDNVSVWLAPQIDIVPEWLTLAGSVMYRAERMRGNGYKLYNHNWSGDAGLMLTHWGFVLSARYTRAQRDLWGEKISWGEDISMINLSYNWKEWEFGAGMIMPFGKYDQGSRSLSRYNTNETHMRLNMRIPYVSVSYNLQWGRQKRGVNKLVNADADVDRSSAGSR